MKVSLLVLPIVLAKRLSENHLQKRTFIYTFAGSVDNALSGTSYSLAGSGSNLAGDASTVLVSNSKPRVSSDGSDAHAFATTTVKSVTGQHFGHQQFSQLDNLLSSKNYAQARSFLGNFDITDKVYISLLKLAVKKGDDAFLVEAINSKPRSVLGDLKLMKYARETSDPDRANLLSSTIANNMGDTAMMGTTGKNSYTDLKTATMISSKAQQLAERFFSQARNEADKNVWREIISDIQTYSIRRAAPPPRYFDNLKSFLRGNDFEKKAAKLYLTNIDKFPIEDFFRALYYALLKGDRDLITFAFSQGTIRRSPSNDAEFMKMARDLHPGPKGEELSRLIGKGIPSTKAEEVLKYAYGQAQQAKNYKTAWEGVAEDIAILFVL